LYSGTRNHRTTERSNHRTLFSLRLPSPSGRPPSPPRRSPAWASASPRCPDPSGRGR